MTAEALPAPASTVVVGLDIGGTTIDGVLLGPDDAVLARARRASGRGPEAVLGNAVDVVAALVEDAGLTRERVAAVGVGVPGTVDPARGVVTNAVNLDLREAALGPALAGALGVAVAVENDVNVAAVGASHRAGHPPSLAFLNVGTGLAAGVVLAGRLVRGATGNAGEIGHLAVDPNRFPCGCGQRGCLETVASGSALARRFGPGAADPAAGVFTRAGQGDPGAAAIVADLHGGLATAVETLVLGLDCERVVLGGGVGALPAVGDGLRAELRRRAATSPFLASLALAGRVRTTRPDWDAARAAAVHGRTLLSP
jgi:predicted NBD/HSP70 family sugar kinase